MGVLDELDFEDWTSDSTLTLTTALTSFKQLLLQGLSFTSSRSVLLTPCFFATIISSANEELSQRDSVYNSRLFVALWSQPVLANFAAVGHSIAPSPCDKHRCFGSNDHGKITDSSFLVQFVPFTVVSVPITHRRNQLTVFLPILNIVQRWTHIIYQRPSCQKKTLLKLKIHTYPMSLPNLVFFH